MAKLRTSPKGPVSKAGGKILEPLEVLPKDTWKPEAVRKKVKSYFIDFIGEKLLPNLMEIENTPEKFKETLGMFQIFDIVNANK